jgi:hypothetical protein
VSRTDEKGTVASLWRTTEGRADDRSEADGESFARGGFSLEVDGVESAGQLRGGIGVNDEIARTRLITDLSRLIRGSSVPEGARMAGLTLIGWLARRREGEAPHTIGIAEALESERRIRAARSKAR